MKLVFDGWRILLINGSVKTFCLIFDPSAKFDSQIFKCPIIVPVTLNTIGYVVDDLIRV